MNVQKFLLALIPVYFYFVPEALFPPLYKRYIKDAFYKISSVDALAYEHIQYLKTRVTRILRFIAFLSVVVVTIITTVYSREHQSFFYKDCLLKSLLIGLCGLSGWMVYLNIHNKFSLTKLEEWMEKVILLFTIPLMYIWG